MTETLRETVTTQGTSVNPVVNSTTRKTSVSSSATTVQTVAYLIYFFFGVLEAFLVFRLILKLAGASASSTFVNFIYGLSGILILPFEGIFRRGYAPGVETASIFEPSTVVAIVVYAVLAWGIIKLFSILSGEQQQTE